MFTWHLVAVHCKHNFSGVANSATLLQAVLLYWILHRVPPLFQHWFPWLFHDQKMKIYDLSAQHIFPNKRYTTYECIPELVVTVPSARSTTVKKIKWFIIWPYKWSRVTFTELLSAVVKIPWHYHHFPWLSMTIAIFHYFPGLENGLSKFHDFPWPGGILLRDASCGGAIQIDYLYLYYRIMYLVTTAVSSHCSIGNRKGCSSTFIPG